jgi:hypothetical protein
MNEQTRYVMAIYELSAIIRDSMEYLLPPGENGYSVEIYKQRQQMIKHLTEENSPFALFCQQNKAPIKDSDVSIGEKISSQVHQFIDDVYGDDPKIVKIDHDKVVVESSLLLQLADYVIGLHETLSDICLGFRKSFEEAKTLDSDFDQLLTVDDPFYRSVAFRAVGSLFVVKFAEFNSAVRSYIAQEREKTGVDPSTQPGFDPKVDPSCSFINNEMSRVVGFFNFLRAHNKSNDVIFKDSIDRMADDFHYFDGSKKVPDGVKLPDVMKQFELIFAPLIPGYRDAWLKVFNKIFGELADYERQMIEKQQELAKQAAPAEAAPAAATPNEVKPEEKKQQ